VSERKLGIEPAAGPEDIAVLRALFLEYQDRLGVDLCFQGFEAELATLPGNYAPPAGGVWLAHVDGALAGCVGLRPHGGGACEMKRLWVRPGFRGLGRRLAATGIAAARRAGYRTLCLDTLGFMDAARALYQTLGFHEIPAYYDNPLEDVRYLELDLSVAARAGAG